MKKHFFAFAATAAFFMPASYAQEAPPADAPKPATRAGNLTIGSGIGLANLSFGKTASSSDYLYQYDAKLSPYVGYFVTDNLLLSGFVSAGAAGSGVRGRDHYRSVDAGIGISGRYYFGKAVNSRQEVRKIRFYGEAGGAYLRVWDHLDFGGGQEYHRSYYDVSLHAGTGINYFINRNIAFEGGLRYNRNLDVQNMGQLRGNVQLQLGVRFFLNRK